MLQKGNSVQHSISLIRLAILLHVMSAAVSITGFVPQLQLVQWLPVDISAAAVLFLIRRAIDDHSKMARWLMLPATFISAPIIFPEQLGSGLGWVLWFATFQCVVQGLVAAYLFQTDAARWFQREPQAQQDVP
jgi:hypothetical protein